jgi:hypothetical protein
MDQTKSDAIRAAVIAEMQRRGLSAYALAKSASIPIRAVQRLVGDEARPLDSRRASALLAALDLKIRRR